jgi:hypothetical protein
LDARKRAKASFEEHLQKAKRKLELAAFKPDATFSSISEALEMWIVILQVTRL